MQSTDTLRTFAKLHFCPRMATIISELVTLVNGKKVRIFFTTCNKLHLTFQMKPYNLLLYTGLILVFTSFFVFNQNNSVDIHLHDTYYVIANTHMFWLLAILDLLVWTLYLFTNKILYSKVLMWIHVIITILTILLFALTLFFGDSFLNPTTRRYYEYSNWNSFDNYTTFTKAIGVSIFILLFGQFIFVINLIVGLFKKLTNHRT